MTTSAPDTSVFGAIDIGASSGRVMAGRWVDGELQLDLVHRFANGAAVADGHLRWNLTGLYAEVLVGLAKLAQRGEIGPNDRVVVYITGEGLKTLDAVRGTFEAFEIEPSYDRFVEKVEGAGVRA